MICTVSSANENTIFRKTGKNGMLIGGRYLALTTSDMETKINYPLLVLNIIGVSILFALHAGILAPIAAFVALFTDYRTTRPQEHIRYD